MQLLSASSQPLNGVDDPDVAELAEFPSVWGQGYFETRLGRLAEAAHIEHGRLALSYSRRLGYRNQSRCNQVVDELPQIRLMRQLVHLPA